MPSVLPIEFVGQLDLHTLTWQPQEEIYVGGDHCALVGLVIIVALKKLPNEFQHLNVAIEVPETNRGLTHVPSQETLAHSHSDIQEFLVVLPSLV